MENLISKIKRKFYDDYYVYITDIDNYKAVSYDGFKLEPLTEELLEDMMKEYKSEIPDEKYQLLKKRLYSESTEKYFIILDENDEIGGYICVAYEDHKEDYTGYQLPNDEDSIYMFDVYTFLSKRGKNLGCFAMSEAMRLHSGGKYKKAYGMVLDKNISQEKNIKKIHFKKIKRVRYCKILKKISVVDV